VEYAGLAMLSITNISNANQAGHYYEKDDYYAKDDPEHKEVSQWFGLGAKLLGLFGQVEKEQFLKILEGTLPNGEQVGRIIDGTIDHACGLDLTFSAPKSVSIISEIKGDRRVAEAHTKAVMKTLEYLEGKFVNTRKQVDGELIKEKVNNIVAAMFRHNTSRALDPQLHTHCVIANVVQRRDNNWRSAEFREIFENKLLLGQIYRSELAFELKQLGYDIRRTGRGLFEIDGISDDVLKHFSKRSRAKEEALKGYDYINSKTAEDAVLRTRQSKQRATKEELHKMWLKECQAIGFDIDKAPFKEEKVKEQKKSGIFNYIQDKFREFCKKFEFDIEKDLSHIDEVEGEDKLTNEEKAVKYAIDHLSEPSSVFKINDLYINALDCSLGIVRESGVSEVIEQKLLNKELLTAKSQESEFKNTYTTKEALIKEKETIQRFKEGISTQKSLYSKVEITKHLKETSLSEGQREAIELLLNTKDRVVGVQGYAGTGKTFMLNKARELANAKGYELIGIAPSATAASVLQKEASIESQTVHRFLFQYKGVIEGRGTIAGRAKMRSDFQNKILILDEASLSSTTQIHELLKVVNELNIRLLLVGDKKQLGAVEAGKPFTQLQKAGMQAATMGDIQRQTNKVLRDIVYDAVNAVDIKDKYYIEKAIGKIGNNLIEANVDMLAGIAANKWLALSAIERENTLITAPSHVIRQQVNELINAALEREGILSGPKEKMVKLENRSFTNAQKTIAQNYEKGNTVMFNKGYKSLGLEKGKYYIVDGINKYNKIRVKDERNNYIYWDPYKIAGSGKGIVEVYDTTSMTIQKGEKLRWTKNSSEHPEIRNSELATVLSITNKHITVQLGSGETKALPKGNKVFYHMDYAYALTVHAAQGKTYKNAIGVLESEHNHLTHQRLFYVALSRAKEKVTLISDDKNKLIETLSQKTGAKSSSMEHQKLKISI
jgi:conjugative relaxase-like TrwC/TraI family protein